MPSRLSLLRLCDRVGCSPPGSSVRGVLQAGALGWAATSSPVELPSPGTKPVSSALARRFFTTEPAGKP